jgi:HEAT repeat protein
MIGGQEVHLYFDSKLIAENESSVRKEAIRALGMMGELRARDRLLRELAMTEPGDEINEVLVGALNENPVSAHSDVIIDLLHYDPNPLVRRDAAAVLEHSSERWVAEELARSVQTDNDSDVCFSAMASLRIHGRKSDITWIEPLVGDNRLEPGFRAVALDVLMRLAEVNPDLETLAKRWIATGLQDADYDVRLSAVVGIGMLGQPFKKECISIVANRTEQIELRAAACKSLAQLNAHEAIGMLLETVRSEKSRRVAEAAAEAILQIDPCYLFFERGNVASDALRKYALSSGCLFYEDKVLNHRGEVIFKSANGIGKDIPLEFLAIGYDGKTWRGFRLHNRTTWYDLGEIFDITPKQTRLLLALGNNKGVLSFTDAVLVASDGNIDASDIKKHFRNVSSHFSKAKGCIRKAFDLRPELHPIALENGEWQARIEIGFFETKNGKQQFIKMGEE